MTENTDFSNDLNCPICQEILIDPVSLPCGHTFCRHCLIGSLKHYKKCASCNKPVVADDKQPYKLSKNIVIANCIEKQCYDIYKERQISIKSTLEDIKNKQNEINGNQIYISNEIFTQPIINIIPKEMLFNKNINIIINEIDLINIFNYALLTEAYILCGKYNTDNKIITIRQKIIEFYSLINDPDQYIAILTYADRQEIKDIQNDQQNNTNIELAKTIIQGDKYYDDDDIFNSWESIKNNVLKLIDRIGQTGENILISNYGNQTHYTPKNFQLWAVNAFNINYDDKIKIFMNEDLIERNTFINEWIQKNFHKAPGEIFNIKFNNNKFLNQFDGFYGGMLLLFVVILSVIWKLYL